MRWLWLWALSPRATNKYYSAYAKWIAWPNMLSVKGPIIMFSMTQQEARPIELGSGFNLQQLLMFGVAEYQCSSSMYTRDDLMPYARK